LAPVPQRGKRNEPAFVKYTAQKVAEIRNMQFVQVAEITTINAKNLFFDK
jgi:TatD DNase family protein